MPSQIERRTLTIDAANIELRSKDKGLPDIVGYSSVFNVLSDDLGGFREKVLPGAFTRTLEHRGRGEGSDPIKAFHNHNPDIVIGSTGAHPEPTLRFEVDEYGLSHTISPPDNEWGRPIVDAVERGDIEGQSIGFRVPQDGAVWTSEDGGDVREVSQIILMETSTVSGWPAFPQTEVGLRSLLAEALDVEAVPDTHDPAELREWLRELLIERARKTAGDLTQPTVIRAKAHLETLAERYNLPLDPEPEARESTPEETTQDVGQSQEPPEGGDSQEVI
jgi:HK97 family phage prohead protease